MTDPHAPPRAASAPDGAIAARCRCGAVRARLTRASRGHVNRVVCHCDDCQAFAHWLRRGDLLDLHGGSDIVQVPPAALAFTEGVDRIAGMRLSPRGLHRFYARCCRTPLGNAVGPALPVIGLPAAAFRDDGQDPDRLFGAPIGAIKGEFATGGAPPGSKGLPLRVLAPTVTKVLGWKLGGLGSPNPFFAPGTGGSRYEVTTLTREERDALRPLCGP